MDKITIHSYQRGQNKRAGGKYVWYSVISGPNPFGKSGGVSGSTPVDGKKRNGRDDFSDRTKAYEFAVRLAAEECLEFIDPELVGRDARKASVLISPSAQPAPSLTEQYSDAESFDPTGLIDTRLKKMIEVTSRPGQGRFRVRLLQAYSFSCPVSDCTVKEAIDAAHIFPHRGAQCDHVCNGLTLRADLHKLFDRFLISVDENYCLRVSKTITDGGYRLFDGKQLKLPKNDSNLPSKNALQLHFTSFLELERGRMAALN